MAVDTINAQSLLRIALQHFADEIHSSLRNPRLRRDFVVYLDRSVQDLQRCSLGGEINDSSDLDF